MSLLLGSALAGFACNKSADSGSNVSRSTAVSNRLAELKTGIAEKNKRDEDARIASTKVLKDKGIPEAVLKQSYAQIKEKEAVVEKVLPDIAAKFVDKYGTGKKLEEASKEEIVAVLDDYITQHPELLPKDPDGKPIDRLSAEECKELCGGNFGKGVGYTICYLACRLIPDGNALLKQLQPEDVK